MSEWMPIETAPKDGTPFDAYAVNGGISTRIPYVRWDAEVGRWFCCYIKNAECNPIGAGWNLTHWMPLPAPPESQP